MPGSFIGELVLQPILEFFFYVICYHMGAIAIPALTFGRVQCDGITKKVNRKQLRWAGMCRRVGNRIHLTADATAVAGMLILVALVVGGCCLFRSSG